MSTEKLKTSFRFFISFKTRNYPFVVEDIIQNSIVPSIKKSDRYNVFDINDFDQYILENKDQIHFNNGEKLYHYSFGYDMSMDAVENLGEEVVNMIANHFIIPAFNGHDDLNLDDSIEIIRITEKRTTFPIQ